MGVKLRTISQLAEAQEVNETDLFEISQHDGNKKYVSKKISYNLLKETTHKKISSDIVTEFDMLDKSGNNISLSSVENKVNNLTSGISVDVENNIILINKIPRLEESEDTKDYSELLQNDYPTVRNVHELISNSASFIGTNSFILTDPVPSSGIGTQDDSTLLKWRIDDNGTDSSEALQPSGEKYGDVECQDSGYLTIYGWLADNGGVVAQEAWVGLFAQIVCYKDGQTLGETGALKWVPIQIQPWIVGGRSSQLQYVGFNVPVKIGTRLKIKTGFPVNGSNTAFNEGNHLVLDNIQPNTFVGYIIQTQDINK